MKTPHHIQSVILIGSGNVATHLALGLLDKDIRIIQIFSPHESHAFELAQKTKSEPISQLNKIDQTADLYLMAIPDGVIEPFAKQMPPVEGIVAHTSGFTPMKVLNRFKHYGVFYPLQTFSKNRTVDLSNIPFLLEAGDPTVMKQLKQLAMKLSQNIRPMESDERKRLHLAAVFVSNFNNYLYLLAREYLDEEGIDFNLLHPLIRETAAKATEMDPHKAQTGPARRNDLKTLQAHLKLLEQREEFRQFYELFSNQILKRYHE